MTSDDRGFTRRLAEGDVVLIDGGTGTELEQRGAVMVEGAWCAMVNLDSPGIVLDVHRSYLEVGAELIITNTFATSRHVCAQGGFEDRFEDINRSAAVLACRARDQWAAETDNPPALVAGAISTTTFGQELPPLETLRVNFADQVKVLAEAGVDLFLLEMMRDLTQTELLLDLIEPTGLPVWVGYSCELVDGEPWLIYRNHRLADALATLADRHVDLVAIMHTEVADVDACLDVVDAGWDGPVGVYAHSGRFDPPNWVFDGVIDEADYAEASRRWLARGVQVIGGCCGIRPSHIDVLRAEVAERRA